jgi:hypothetical protein
MRSAEELARARDFVCTRETGACDSGRGSAGGRGGTDRLE